MVWNLHPLAQRMNLKIYLYITIEPKHRRCRISVTVLANKQRTIKNMNASYIFEAGKWYFRYSGLLGLIQRALEPR
jgi:hypothetical protein